MVELMSDRHTTGTTSNYKTGMRAFTLFCSTALIVAMNACIIYQDIGVPCPSAFVPSMHAQRGAIMASFLKHLIVDKRPAVCVSTALGYVAAVIAMHISLVLAVCCHTGFLIF